MNGQFDIGEITPARYFFGIAAVLGLLFALITPGTDQDWDLMKRLLQWQLQALGPMAFLIATHLLLDRLPAFDRLNPWLKLFYSGLLGALLFSPLALLLDVWLANEIVEKNNWLHAWLRELGGFVPPVTICWIAINAPWLLGFRLNKTSQPDNHILIPNENLNTPELGNKQKSEPAFYSLLPDDIKDELVFLKAELHYLEVVTKKGKALILYNLKDAISDIGEIANYQGFQPHRSFWVSKKYIKSLAKEGRQGKLQLANGESIPVSRRNMDKARFIADHLAISHKYDI